MNLTLKQENVCLAYLETGNASEAYRQAYRAGKMKPETVNRKAVDLLENGKITARLQELRQPAVEAAQVTLEGHLRQLADLRDKAIEAQQYSAAIVAEHHRGKAAGLYVERSENVTRNYVVRVPAKIESVDEWASRYTPTTH
jgi:phage terminase small subunit